MKKNKDRMGGMEILWICMAVLSIFYAVKVTVLKGFGESYPFFIFVVMSVLMFLWRRSLRKKENENDGKKMQ